MTNSLLLKITIEIVVMFPLIADLSIVFCKRLPELVYQRVMLYMVTFTINIPPMLALIYQHHGSYPIIFSLKMVDLSIVM